MVRAALAIFGLGVVSAVLSHQQRWGAGLEMMLFASAAGPAGYLIDVATEATFNLDL